MKNTITREVVYLVGAFLFGIVIFSILYLFISYFAGPNSMYKQMEKMNTGPYTVPPFISPKGDVSKDLVFRLDKIQSYKDLKLIYRGFDDEGYILIDLYVTELDPDSGYSYRIHPGDAKKNFELDKYAFRLKSARRSHIELEEIAPSF
jgi:hypothetical protein